MAAAPCQLQAEVNDFKKVYSHPNLESLAGTTKEQSPKEKRTVGNVGPATEKATSEQKDGPAGASSIDTAEAASKDISALLRKSPKKSPSANGYDSW